MKGTSFNNQITGISFEKLQGYMDDPNKSYRDYKSQQYISDRRQTDEIVGLGVKEEMNA